MELELTKIDYFSVSPVIGHCLKLLPVGGVGHQQQRVSFLLSRLGTLWKINPLLFQLIIGDQEGSINLLHAKRDSTIIQLETDFKVEAPSKIQSIQLGGVMHTVPDKIFVCLENRVCGYNKKGKLFLSFDTNLTEAIKVMFVNGPDLMICGNHVYNHYKDCKDVGSYLCGDLIVDMVALYPNNVRDCRSIVKSHINQNRLSDKSNCDDPSLFWKSAAIFRTLPGPSDGRIGECANCASCAKGVFG